MFHIYERWHIHKLKKLDRHITVNSKQIYVNEYKNTKHTKALKKQNNDRTFIVLLSQSTDIDKML